MKKVILILATVIVFSAPGCKKEPRWLYIYNDGKFEDSLDVSDWEVNEDVVQFGCDFYYPWQGENSIDYRGCEFYQGKKIYLQTPTCISGSKRQDCGI